MSWRWRLGVAGVVMVLLAMAATFVLPLVGGGGDTEAATTTAAGDTAGAAPAPGPAPGPPPASTPPRGAAVPPEPAGTPPVAPADAGTGLQVVPGTVGVSRVYATAPTARVVVVAYRLDRRAAVDVTVIDARGRTLARATAQPAAAGPRSEILTIPEGAAIARVVVVASPLGAAGTPTVATLTLAAEPPRLEVLAPGDGAVLRGRRVTVRLRTSGVRIADRGAAPRPDRRHFHLTLDERPYIVVYGSRATFTDVPPGAHTLVVTPALDDHSPAPAPAPVTVRFATTG